MLWVSSVFSLGEGRFSTRAVWLLSLATSQPRSIIVVKDSITVTSVEAVKGPSRESSGAGRSTTLWWSAVLFYVPIGVRSSFGRGLLAVFLDFSSSNPLPAVEDLAYGPLFFD